MVDKFPHFSICLYFKISISGGGLNVKTALETFVFFLRFAKMISVSFSKESLYVSFSIILFETLNLYVTSPSLATYSFSVSSFAFASIDSSDSEPLFLRYFACARAGS